ncbi:uncharacterized protein LOC124356340 isoform X2 [Homalodisca vitripennis]|uniref:uncharacterized protein LOC124356340 isoform X2 n=1 Tax=Homalodisca vitripennis TaxID=197043 RepID=UPI001EEC380C|nr:uncharacterized protein LOC124356340 isoform X2 [Homalodisca vitripennis]
MSFILLILYVLTIGYTVVNCFNSKEENSIDSAFSRDNPLSNKPAEDGNDSKDSIAPRTLFGLVNILGLQGHMGLDFVPESYGDMPPSNLGHKGYRTYPLGGHYLSQPALPPYYVGCNSC